MIERSATFPIAVFHQENFKSLFRFRQLGAGIINIQHMSFVIISTNKCQEQSTWNCHLHIVSFSKVRKILRTKELSANPGFTKEKLPRTWPISQSSKTSMFLDLISYSDQLINAFKIAELKGLWTFSRTVCCWTFLTLLLLGTSIHISPTWYVNECSK